MRGHLIAALDVGSTKTSAVIGEVLADSSRPPVLNVLGVGQARTSGMRREVVAHIEETTESVLKAMKEAELMAGVTVDRLFAGIAGDHIQGMPSLGMVAVGGEEISRDDVERAHKLAQAVHLPPDRELIHAIPREYRVDQEGGVVDPVGMAGMRLEAEVYLVTASASAANNLRKAVSRAGYGVQELVLEPLAASRAVLTQDEREIGVALVEVGGGTTEVAVFHEGMFRHVAIFPFGGLTVTQDLVKGLSIPFQEAQKAKEHHGAALAQLVDPRETVELPGPAPGQRRHVARELIAHVVEQRMDEIFGLVREDLERHGLLDLLGAGVVLTGGSVTMAGMAELAGQALATAVRIGLPGEGLSGLAEPLALPRFATVAGLALYGMDRFLETGQGASTPASNLMTRLWAWVREFF